MTGHTGRLLALAALVIQTAFGADVYARRMEILKTPNGQETVFRDSVRITDGDTRITAGRARLNDRLGVAVIADSVVIVNPDAVVRADSAVYRLEAKRTELYGTVEVEQESLLISAPALVYSIPQRLVEATDGVQVRSRTRNMWLSGDRGSYDMDEELGVVDSNPVLVEVTDDDTVVVRAREISWHESGSKAVAQGKVQVASGRAGLSCDTLFFYPSRDSGVALGNPVVSDSLSSTKGDTVVMRMADGRLDRVWIAGGATGTYTTDGGNRIDVAGREIAIDFEGGEVLRIEVFDMTSGRLARNAGSAAPEQGEGG